MLPENTNIPNGVTTPDQDDMHREDALWCRRTDAGVNHVFALSVAP